MNKIINKFLFTVEKCLPVLRLEQPGFTYNACGPVMKHHKRIKKFRKTPNLKHSVELN